MILEPSVLTSDVNIPAHVPIHHTIIGLVTTPFLMASQILYSSVPPTCYQYNKNTFLNSLGPKSDQHQFSPNNVSRSLRVKVMRITKFITKGRSL